MNLKFLSASFWIRSFLFTFTNRFSLIIFGAVSYMLLAKKIFPSAAEMGVWALFQTVISGSGIIKLSMLRLPVIKFLGNTRDLNEKNIIQSNGLAINIAFSILAGLFILFFGKPFCNWLHSPQLLPLCYWGLLILLLMIPFDHCDVLLQAHFKFRSILFGYLIKQGLFLAGIIICIFFHTRLSLINLVQMQAVALLVATLLFVAVAWQYFKKGFVFRKSVTISMFHYAKYTFGTDVFSFVARSSDSFLTANRILDSEDIIGYYNFYSRLSNLIDVPSFAASDVLLPKSVDDFATKGKFGVRDDFEKVAGGVLSIVVPISLMIFIFPGFLIKTFASAKYLPIVPVLHGVILFSAIRPFFYLFGTAMNAIGKPNYSFWVMILQTPVHLFLVNEGLHIFGWMGSAFASVAGSCITFTVISIILRKTIGIRFRMIIKFFFTAYKDMLGIVLNIFRKPVQQL